MKLKSKHHYFLALAAAITTSGQLHALNVVDDTVTPDAPLSTTITVAGNATVNGTLTVQPTVLVTPGVPVVTPGLGGTTDLGGVVAGTGGDVIVTQTLIDTTNNSQVVTGGGGATIQTNGDTQLSAPTATTSTVDYGRAVSFEVAQAGNANPVGLAIPGTEVYYLTNAAGVQVVGAPTFTSEALLDAYIATLTPATILALDPALGTQVTAAGAGGNLTVDGQTTTNGIDNSGQTITNVAAGVAATDAANVGQVTAETTRATTAEGVLTTNLANEVTNRIADVNAEELRATTAEGVLTTNLASEVTNRIAGDAAVTTAFQAADTSIRNDFSAADSQIRSDYQAADQGLRSDIDQNTRGIAMVAAMTNTTVEAGKTHGVDFNVAQFQSETGMSFGYANRINENMQIHVAAASTTDFDEAVGRIGVSYQW